MNADIKMIAMGCKPDPYKFQIVSLEHFCGHSIILANYDGCKTFGGNKLMLLRGLHKVEDFATLDPHFLDEEYAVVGRFIPTDLGMKMAKGAATAARYWT